MLEEKINDFLTYCKVSNFSKKSIETFTIRLREFNSFIDIVPIYFICCFGGGYSQGLCKNGLAFFISSDGFLPDTHFGTTADTADPDICFKTATNLFYARKTLTYWNWCATSI
ncbi:MAG: hypothetical protein KKC46_10160 [Proteobacteria bacterium]|nr:hypothetical protein [Pseudomonadota bacterium]